LDVAGAAGLRPTPDRVRETLFNWLAPTIAGARCLDAFAGTGALGIEALSRGAASCLFVERNPALARSIGEALAALGADRGELRRGDALDWLKMPAAARFDVVFLDPPFTSGLLAPALAALPPHLAPGHRVYLEYPANETPALGPKWSVLRDKRAGEVGYCLASHLPAAEDSRS
jgi:16S rRNA (guanine966-N2)-methyltransferase